MPAKRRLTLNAKVALTVAGAFSVLMACFAAVLLPLQQHQRERVRQRDERLVATLRETYERDLVYDILSQNRESLALDAAALCRQPGLLWVTVQAKGMTLSGTADTDTKRRLLEGVPDVDPADGAALMIGEGGASGLVAADGRPRTLPDIPPERLAPWAAGAAPDPSGRFQEIRWPTGVAALRSDTPLMAAEQVFGRLQVVYSLAEVERAERQVRLVAYLLATAVALTVLLLLKALLSRVVISPVRDLAQAMRRASEGDLSVRLDNASGDEIGMMAESFNAMVGELEEARRDLEAKVEERTHALHDSERRLQDLSSHLQAVIANAATGVVSLDAEGRIAAFNQRAAEVLALPREDLAGRKLQEALRGHAAEGLVEIVDGVARDAPAKARLDLRLPQGRRMLAVVASPLPSESGRELGTVIVIDDLTQVLTAQRLEAWKDAVEQVIHEIKNPLTPIGLAIETLRVSFRNDRPRFDALFPDASGLILRSVADLKTLIAEFTLFARMPRMLLRRLDVNALLREVLAPYAQAEGASVRVRADLVDGLPAIEADAEQLKRVLLNVINNGLEAMAERPGEIVVRARAAGSEVVISVEDAGVGIEDPERVFEPRYTTKPKGTGLGLAISQQIVEEHGGRIEISSTVGAGTSVRICLPAENTKSAS